MKRIEDYIILYSKKYPQKMAIVDDTSSLTYAELYNAIRHRAGQLTNMGVKAHDCVVYKSTQTTAFLINYFAIHYINAIAVPLESDVSDIYLSAIKQETIKSQIPENVADILFTTGTTGKSKGVMISHEAIVANAENLIDSQKFSSEIVFIISGPLNHIGSLSKVYPTLMLGGTILITVGLKNINTFYSALDYPCKKIATFLVPSMIRMLLQLSSNRLKQYAEKIDFIETGAAPISQFDMDALCKILPHSRLYNTYASTETGIICTHNFNTVKCSTGCLGKPMKNSGIIITKEGKIVCTGRTLMVGYLNSNELTKTILYDNKLHTNDNGYMDKDGCLHLIGRDDDVINVGGYKVAPTEVENVTLSFPKVQDCICISEPHSVLGSALKILVVLEKGYELNKKELAKFIKNKMESYKVPLFYEQVEKIQRTFNGKLNRKYYKQN